MRASTKPAKTIVAHLSRLRSQRFGAVRLRPLPDGGLLGDASVIHEHLPPESRLPEVHHRRTAELVYCISGTMIAYLDGKKRRVRPGGVLLIPPGVRHRFVTGKNACTSLSVFAPALHLAPGADVHAEP